MKKLNTIKGNGHVATGTSNIKYFRARIFSKNSVTIAFLPKLLYLILIFQNMPRRYRRSRRYKRRRIGRRGRFARRRATRGYVNRAISKQQERKHRITDLTGPITNNITVSSTMSGELTFIPTGITDTTRVGDRLRIKSIRYRFHVAMPTPISPIPPDFFNNVRFVIVQWKRAYDQTNNAQNIMGAFLGQTFGWNQLYTHDMRRQFRVLVDKTLHLVPNTRPTILVKGLLKRGFAKNIDYFQATSGAMPNGTNPIFFGIISDSSAEPHPYWEGFIRVNFTDS